MAPLIILLSTFAVLYVGNRLVLARRLELSMIGRISMAATLVATGISHFTETAKMIEMMPEIVPFKREMVYFTGICELAAVIGLLWDKTSRVTSILLIVFFLSVLPANIAGSLKQVQLGGMEYGASYLYFRIPLQLLFILWTWYFGIRLANRGTESS